MTNHLTPRECQILELTANGHRNSDITGALRIKANTLREHRAHILNKLGVHSQIEAVAWAWRNGFIMHDSGSRRIVLR